MPGCHIHITGIYYGLLLNPPCKQPFEQNRQFSSPLIYDYGENLYISYFTATEDYNAGSNTDAYNTLININGIDYYINELHSDRAEGDEVFCFRAGMTVNISEEKADSYKKSMEVYSGKTYIVIINTADMTATMIED